MCICMDRVYMLCECYMCMHGSSLYVNASVYMYHGSSLCICECSYVYMHGSSLYVYASVYRCICMD